LKLLERSLKKHSSRFYFLGVKLRVFSSGLTKKGWMGAGDLLTSLVLAWLTGVAVPELEAGLGAKKGLLFISIFFLAPNTSQSRAKSCANCDIAPSAGRGRPFGVWRLILVPGIARIVRQVSPARLRWKSFDRGQSVASPWPSLLG